MSDDRDHPEPPIEDSGMRRILADVRAALGREPAQVERRSGYRGPGTRHEERREANGMSAWAKVGLGYVIPALFLAAWVGRLHQQVDDLRAAQAGDEIRREQLQTLRSRVDVLEERIRWMDGFR
jgi:hypothetical protein